MYLATAKAAPSSRATDLAIVCPNRNRWLSWHYNVSKRRFCTEQLGHLHSPHQHCPWAPRFSATYFRCKASKLQIAASAPSRLIGATLRRADEHAEQREPRARHRRGRDSRQAQPTSLCGSWVFVLSVNRPHSSHRKDDVSQIYNRNRMVRGVAEQQEHANRVAHHDHVPVVLLRNAQLARRHDLTAPLSPTASWLGESARSQYALGLTEFVTSVASPITAAQDLGPAPAVVREEDEHHADVVPPHAPRAIPDPSRTRGKLCIELS